MTAAISVKALTDVQRFFDELPDIAEQAAVLAINDTVEREGLTLIKRDMRDQINFPSGYLEQQVDGRPRLGVARKALRGRLEAVIRGRDRPTSLARFAPGNTPQNSRGRPITVRVKKGRSQVLRGAFLVNLNQGRSIGLAVRLKPGETLRESEGAVRLDNNVYLLYGPSVDQVLRGVAEDRGADLAEIVGQKFLRQFGRLARG